MIEISSYSVQYIKDPFGILTGKRYEFIIDIEAAEDDDIYSPKGLYVRAVFAKDGDQAKIAKHEIIERETERILDFELEDEEEQLVLAFCQEHWHEADE
ncbi:pullulanase [Paenibacillus sp. BIHB 4019]|uniref:Pullulanase n=1 Tax=Paenibacillus sp. BIHB 4019 TaxID=1870819 RepID=A0A1B2DK12_9BACL|nr:DUF6509 family protein [Paenibacillus sp. BIHB 4019]ANY68021.1 pullulanase [Paenibacillus sp. BIHB 4019]